MENKKQIDSLRRRNADLNAEVFELKKKLEEAEAKQPDEQQKATMKELEDLKAEWETQIAELKKKSAECDKMMGAMKESNQVVKTMGFKLPWYKRIRLRHEQKVNEKERQKEIQARVKEAEESKEESVEEK